MKLIVEAPKGMLDELRTCKFPIQDAYRLCEIIENGTPLPEGHGRLIDADALKKKAVMCPTVGNAETLLLDISDVENAPTIIEADEEGAEAYPISENISKGFEEFTRMMFKQGTAESEDK